MTSIAPIRARNDSKRVSSIFRASSRLESPFFHPPKILAEGRLNNLSVKVFEDGVADPSPTCRYVAHQEALRMVDALATGRCVLKELATGDSHVARYQYLADEINDLAHHRRFSWKTFVARTFWCHGDENRGVSPHHPASFAHYVKTKFFDRLEMPHALYFEEFLPNHCFFLDGESSEQEQRGRYESFLRRVGSTATGKKIKRTAEIAKIERLNFEVSLGLGPKGHILFNEAINGPFRFLPMGDIALGEATRRRNDATYQTDFTHAFTWRQEIFWGNRIEMIVTKPHYAEELLRAFGEPYTDARQRNDFCPARELLHHHNVHLYLSTSAARHIVPLLC